MKEIILYADEFDYDVWETYCNILGESPRCTSLTLRVAESVAD